MRLFTILLALVQKVGAINNYITEQGTDVSWTYRKWNNGKAEAWGIINMPSPITPISEWRNVHGRHQWRKFPGRVV